MYPNPAVNKQTKVVMVGLKANAQIPVRLINTQGTVVFETLLISDKSGSIKQEIDVQSLPSGIYILVLTSPSLVHKKLVIN